MQANKHDLTKKPPAPVKKLLLGRHDDVKAFAESSRDFVSRQLLATLKLAKTKGKTMAGDHPVTLSRRHFLGTSAVTAMTLATTSRAVAGSTEPNTSTFVYEVTRSDEEWRDMLSEDEYVILRKGSTELPKTSPLWEEQRAGHYNCKGCDLTVYQGNWKVVLSSKGWAFFKHAEPDTVLTGIDGPVEQYGSMTSGPGAFMEAHCRRCGSHLGHILIVEGQLLHCINGTALDFIHTSA